jgi:predicted dithiol-disulfide oxidoreductase (DUF899 family)
MNAIEDNLHNIRMPGEDPHYRRARNRLLAAERELRRQVEEVAALRRKLPPGGLVPQDYAFQELPGESAASKPRSVPLSTLFGRHDTLIAYSFMYGPRAKAPCPMCSAMLDSLDRAAPHIGQRAALVVIARSPIGRIVDFARKRGWSGLRLLSSEGNDYNRDYFAENDKGDQMPVLNVFRRTEDGIRHFWHSELLYVRGGEGEHPRHVDMIWPLWNVLDLTPEGRAADWLPRLEY